LTSPLRILSLLKNLLTGSFETTKLSARKGGQELWLFGAGKEEQRWSSERRLPCSFALTLALRKQRPHLTNCLTL
jgi:hypothetical protein